MDTNWQPLDELWSAAQQFFQFAMALPSAVGAAVLCAPVVLAVITRSALSTLGAVLLVALSAAAFSQPAQGSDGALFGCAAYVGAVLLALRGFSEQRKARLAKLMGADVEAMRRDMNNFVSALERRAKTIDEFHIRKSHIDAE